MSNENVNVIAWDENKEVRKSYEQNLWKWNLICCILHSLQAVVILFLGIYTKSSKFKLPMTTVFLNWENNMPKQELVIRGFIQFAAVCSSFSWLSAAAHLLVLIFLFGIMINSIKFRKLSFIPLLLTIKLKLFPIFLVIIYFFKKLILKNFYQPLIIIVICLFSINEFFILNKIYNKSNVTLAYSADTIFAIINYYYKINYLNIKLISFLALLLLITLSFSKKKTFVNNDKLNNKIFFLIGALILVPSFFLSNTYDYKFIFIIFCIPHILKINKIRNTFITLILMCIWIEFLIFYSRNYSNISNILSNNTLNLNYYSYLFILFTITKNIFYWIINYYLIVISKNILVIEIYKKK
jgi:hypothetical protein